MALLMSTTMAWAQFSGGSGKSNDPFLISDLDDWEALCVLVQGPNGPGTGNTLAGYYIKQTADIDIQGLFWGIKNTVYNYNFPFSGFYVGGGHTIITYCDYPDDDYIAPFMNINGATIQNLTIDGIITGRNHCAGAVGAATGTNTIRNVKVTASVNSTGSYCGGILGHSFTSSTTLDNCVFAGCISATGTSYVGALWGWSDSGSTPTIKNCLEAGTSYTATNFNPVGMCSTWGTVDNTYYVNPVTGSTTHVRHNSRGLASHN